MAIVTAKGQITLPKWVRESLGLEAGSQIEFEIESDGVRIRRRVPRERIEQWVGCLPTNGEFADVDALLDELRGA